MIKFKEKEEGLYSIKMEDGLKNSVMDKRCFMILNHSPYITVLIELKPHWMLNVHINGRMVYSNLSSANKLLSKGMSKSNQTKHQVCLKSAYIENCRVNCKRRDTQICRFGF